MSATANAYVVNGLCQKCKDTACVDVCPVECFYEPKQPDPSDPAAPSNLEATGLPDQLYIHPGECINCDACVSACPWGAITSGDDVPDVFLNFIALNARAESESKLFKPAWKVNWQFCSKCQTKTNTGKPACTCNAVLHPYAPSTDEVDANNKKWGFTP